MTMLLDDLLKNNIELQKLISGMPDDVRSRCVIKNISAGSTVVKKEERIKYVYILVKGEVKVLNEFENGDIYSFARVLPISFIGELEVVAGELENAVTIEAVTDCLTVRITSEEFARWIECDHYTLMLVANILAKKLYPAAYEIGNGLFTSGISKVKSFLINYYRKKAVDEGPLLINLNRQQIADEMGISVKTVNRSIKKLKDEGLLCIKKGKINISKNQFLDLQADSKNIK